jgi:hypothetical protein
MGDLATGASSTGVNGYVTLAMSVFRKGLPIFAGKIRDFQCFLKLD